MIICWSSQACFCLPSITCSVRQRMAHNATVACLRNADVQSRPQKLACSTIAEPKVLAEAEVPAMKWTAPDMDGLVKFLVEEKSFNEDRVRKAVERINSSRGKSNQGALQQRAVGCLEHKE
jgi:hypothetical protein